MDINNKKRLPGIQLSSNLLLTVSLLRCMLTFVLSFLVAKLSLQDLLNSDATASAVADAVFEMLLLGIPLLVFMGVGKYDFRETLRLNSLQTKEILLLCLIGFLVYFASIYYAQANYLVAEIFTDIKLPESPKIVSTIDIITNVFVTVLIAPVLEEMMFRGAIMRGLEGRSKWFAIIITGTFFGLLHISYYTIIQKVLAGIILCYVVYVADSLYAGIIIHMMNNGLALLSQIIVDSMPAEEASASATVVSDASTMDLAISAFIDLFIALAISVGVIALVQLLRKITRKPSADGTYVYKCRLREKTTKDKTLSIPTLLYLIFAFVIVIGWKIITA